MRYLHFTISILLVCLFSCNQNNRNKESRQGSTVKLKSIDTLKTSIASTPTNAKLQIQSLIRKVLNWRSIDLLPAIFDSKDSTCTGFNMAILKVNLEKLKASNLFSAAFIENYNQIILTLDKKIKSKEIEPWRTGELPTFIFANDIDPWTLCQDVPYDEPNPLDFVEVTIVNINKKKGELYWQWGNLRSDQDHTWKEFRYNFNVEQENGVWKISYLQGFDFKESTRKDGM
jgi:hypothetical protein